MKAAPSSVQLERWHRFLRWFFNTSPEAALDTTDRAVRDRIAAVRKEDSAHATRPRQQRRGSGSLNRASARS